MASRLVGTSSSTRTLDERDLSSLRPAKENAPRPRKPTVLREVTNGIVCFCGERFGESESLEFMLHLRAEVGEVLDWRERYRERERERHQKAWRDPEYRERQSRRKQQYAADPAYRERERERQRERNRKRWADPEYREAMNARSRELRADPEYRERYNAQTRERRARKKAEREAQT
jgi:hypothetical protein